MSLEETVRRMKNDEMLRRILHMIEDEPLFPRSVFEDMGLFRGLLHTVWMIFHPYMNARLSAAGFRNSILRKLNKF